MDNESNLNITIFHSTSSDNQIKATFLSANVFYQIVLGYMFEKLQTAKNYSVALTFNSSLFVMVNRFRRRKLFGNARQNRAAFTIRYASGKTSKLAEYIAW